jgi:hypothetical protein
MTQHTEDNQSSSQRFGALWHHADFLKLWIGESVSLIGSLGALGGGWLGKHIGLQPTLLVGAVGLLSTWLWIVFSPVRRLRAFSPQEITCLPSSKQSSVPIEVSAAKTKAET